MTATRIVVVGASLAGLRACEALRQEGFDGTITLIGAEAEMPYDRPPLSKKVLAGEWEADRIRLRKAEEFATLGLDLRLGAPAEALDTDGRTVTVGGEEIAYDGLIVATGGMTDTVGGTNQGAGGGEQLLFRVPMKAIGTASSNASKVPSVAMFKVSHSGFQSVDR